MSDAAALRARAAEARLVLDVRRLLEEFPDVFADLGLRVELESALAAYDAERAGSFTCPVCGRTSWHPVDVAERWCGACRGATGYPPPPGMGWVLFVGGELDGSGRLLDESRLELGMTYDVVATGDVYRFDGRRFELERVEWPA